jgi:tRNA threonylcarbamoyladenosine biosynthesis protein TsaB
MHVLAIETSTSRSSVAIVDHDRVLASAALGVPRRHGEFVAPAIRFCLDQAGLTAERLTGVAVGLGPGLFTGLRVGIATAQSLAASLHLPAVGMSSLDVLAFQVRYAPELICAVIDARRGELYWAFYRALPGGVQRQDGLRLGTIEQLTAELESQGDDILVVGDGAMAHRRALEQTGAELAGPENGWPDASVLGELAAPRFVREETQRATDLQPIYLRDADAQLGWERRGRLRGGDVA